ncbi:SulP family inorganic anion transporter [Metapseudomonas boanensis]|uniref:SulP family inorganic anion transporter n=1 Tax=Metapseudomonas boanensis TaxID=2822138 RepID=A0ABS5XI54_9GAMM|nr:SulP family inorganic anion transporter [Pseudomonas boanensis]MBT8767359.1 SulP family inorganic anion transporter [Pseudomonas boanensis]
MRPSDLFPFLRWLPSTTYRSLGCDALVGLTGAILALPQSIAYALIAGLPAEYGLYAAVVPVIVACLWGSSRHLIGGPTAAISVVLFASVSPLALPGSGDYIGLVLLLTFLAGAFQWLLGALRFGSLANFVSQSVVLGFTLGAALVIALGQVPNLLGLANLEGRATALQSTQQLAGHLGEMHWPSLLVAAVTLAVAVLVRSLWPRLPALLIAIAGASLLVVLLPGTFGRVALVPPFIGSLPPLANLQLDFEDLLRLLPSAVACGLLGLVTSLSIARALARQSGQALDANLETRGQGLSNLIGAWFSGYLSAGSFTRSALNLQAGATSPLAGVFSAIWVALFALLGAHLIAHIPLPAMAASILLICWGLVDIRGIRQLWRVSRSEFVVMTLTCAATLLLELQTAIYAGVLASLFFYLKRTSQPRVMQAREGEDEVLRIEGSIFFGACPYLQRLIQRSQAARLVLDAHHVNFIDYAGVSLLHDEARRLGGEGRCLVLRRARPQVERELRKLEDSRSGLVIEG